MIRLFFIRHGETDWNRQRKLQGHTDIPLNPRGVLQAEGLRPVMQALAPDFVYSSDLARARETAEGSLPGRRLVLTPELREINLGLAEGGTREEIQERHTQALWDRWADGAWPSYDARFPEGESRLEGLQRIFGFLHSRQAEWKDGSSVACYSHGLLLRSFAHWCANIEIPRYTTPNACVYEWRWEPSRDLDFHSSDPAKRPQLQQIYLLPDEALTL